MQQSKIVNFSVTRLLLILTHDFYLGMYKGTHFTGSGKSAIAIAAAMTLGSSYILVGSKELQSQYQKDFSWVMSMKGKNNFRCEIKDDFIKDGTFVCKPCGGLNRLQRCHHTSVEYGRCCDEKFRCKYKTKLVDYQVTGKGTKDEMISLDANVEGYYKDVYSEWSHMKNLKEPREWRPCQYFHQRNIALTSSHSVLNYAMFLSLENLEPPPLLSRGS